MKCETTGFTLQDILLLLGLKEATGELVLESGNNIGTIILHKGKVLQASSPYSRAIGDLLVEDGIITEGELLEILMNQKKSAVAPIGVLFLKTGKISFEVIEMMVHEQIRQSIREFVMWNKLRVSFVEKEVIPFDRINLPVHEFIPPETLKSAASVCSLNPDWKDKSPSAPAASTTA
ncbi:MAG TPA: DUF4388 domain-containing protein [Nitrospirota bacterium]|nr:DUF4388 domain-containing protein [Nitrospirota bacterium]